MSYEDDEIERSANRRSRARQSMSRSGTGKRTSAKDADRKKNVRGGTSAAGSTPDSASTKGTSHSRRKKSGSRWKKILIAVIIAIILLIVIAVVAVTLYFKNYIDNADKNDFNVDEVTNLNLSVEQKEAMETGYWTLAVFGLDSRDGSTGKGNQSDVIMIVNINRSTGEIKLVSVFRDTYLNISDKDAYNKINAAYAQGGPEQAVKALNKNLDLNITNYATFNWAAVATAINVLGGVDIEISNAEFYYINSFITETVQGTGIGSTQLTSAGLQHLDGVQAVAYGRLRLMDTDYARTERQRIVIQKAFEQAKQTDIATLTSLAGVMFEMCSTNVSWDDLMSLVPNVTKYYLGDSLGFPMARGEQMIRSMDCVIPQTLESNVKSLHEFLFDEEDYEPSETVKTISRKIAETSGLYNAGTEIGHVSTNQGYIPKETSASSDSSSAGDSDEEDEDEEDGEDENEDGEDDGEDTGEDNAGGDSPAAMVGVSPGDDDLTPSDGEDESSLMPTTASSTDVVPTAASFEITPTTAVVETNEDGGPKSPMDVVTETTAASGPGLYEEEEETMSPGAVATDSVVASPTTAAETASSSAAEISYLSPADETTASETAVPSSPASASVVSDGPASQE